MHMIIKINIMNCAKKFSPVVYVSAAIQSKKQSLSLMLITLYMELLQLYGQLHGHVHALYNCVFIPQTHNYIVHVPVHIQTLLSQQTGSKSIIIVVN